jgi:hypothetical protein
VVERLEQLADGDFSIDSLPLVDEGIVFQLPAALR